MRGCDVSSELLLHSVQFQFLLYCILSEPGLIYVASILQQCETGKFNLSSHVVSICLLLVHISHPVSTNFLTFFFIICVHRFFIFGPVITLFWPHCLIFTLYWIVACVVCVCVRPEILGARPLGLQRGIFFLRSPRPHVYCCRMSP